MKRTWLALTLILAACDGSSGSSPDPVVTPTVIDPETVGTIKGKVTFSGTPPKNPKISMASECAALHESTALNEEVLVKDGRLQGVFVYVKEGLEKMVFDWPKTPLRIANAKCIYVPRVAGVQVNQSIEFANEDLTVHNIHGFGADSMFNFSIQGKGAQNHKLRAPVVMVRLKCDIHPWMVGWIGALPHPFFQVTGADGAFELKGLPAGEYTLEAWHEKYGTQTRKAKLDAKGSFDVEFGFSEK
jgi:hypothetical protein